MNIDKDSVILDTEHGTYKRSNDNSIMAPSKLEPSSALQRKNSVQYVSLGGAKRDITSQEKVAFKSRQNVFDGEADKAGFGINESTHTIFHQKKTNEKSYSDPNENSSE